ncbi:cobalt ABC transporter permease [Spiroplasma sp. TIUS-1]|uniref:energy-coupling factor transporter transmembrane component T family protein n=1 Tax=Spiroplasma sp. TIUS-1 TaxID=216963 RepID=UPI001398A4FD|nr:energy-coupling factor transporter transmembrane component T [Spiroplasma sp. TIUS-1]QHX36152.1 cobalt ABC transporter permease [Spiroplasma sp. TIUS-1]
MRMTFGRYIPNNSIMHKMDPRLKLLMIIVMIVVLFLPIGFTGFALIGPVILLMYTISKLRWTMLFKILIPVSLIFVVLLIINVFAGSVSYDKESANWEMIANGIALLKQDSRDGFILILGGAKISADGHVATGFMTISEATLYNAIYMTLRIFLMITLTSILAGTTQPLALTLAIEDLLWPLKAVGFPVFIFSTIISIALRMIPTLIDEAGRIMKAQASRGIDFKNGKLKDKAKTMVSLIIPLLVSSFQKAEDLAYAMDSRGYDPSAKRTRYRQFHFRFADWIFFSLGLAACILLMCYPFVDTLSWIQIPRIDNILNI